MRRLLASLLWLVPLVALGLWLADHPGNVRLRWQDYEIETSLTLALLVLSIGIIFVIFIVSLLQSLVFLPTRWRYRRQQKQAAHGLDAITRTLSALALQDAQAAQKSLKAAQKTLGAQHPAVQLLSMQAPKNALLGDASLTIDAMLENKHTYEVALRAKINAHLQQQEHEAALLLLEPEWKKTPNNRWMAPHMVALVARTKDWPRLQFIIQKSRSKRGLDATAADYYEALCHVMIARDAIARQQIPVAIKSLKAALRLQPALVQAHLLLCQLYMQKQDKKRLLSTAKDAWQHCPMPQIAEWLRASYQDAKPARQYEILHQLVEQSPTHPESYVAEAQLLMAHQEWEQAREKLKAALGQNHRAAKVYELLSEIEQADGADEAQAHFWQQQALHAPKDAHWHCHSCQTMHDEWQMICPDCQAFDSIHWQQPTI